MSLALKQQALLEALFYQQGDSADGQLSRYVDINWKRGYQVYRANAYALASRALHSAYPVMAQLIGQESFEALAKALWHAHPPRCGDVAQWGGELAQVILDSDLGRDEPYLPDVAQLEWAIHQASTAPDGEVAPGSFALLAGEYKLNELVLQLVPGCALLFSPWPIVSILNAHLIQAPSMTEVGGLIQCSVGENAIVWRAGFKVKYRELEVGEEDFVSALLSGQTLGGALEVSPSFDIAVWLPKALQSGLLLGVHHSAISKPDQVSQDPNVCESILVSGNNELSGEIS